MTSHSLSYGDRSDAPRGWMLAWGVLWILWQVVRLPVLAVLLVLEPFVSLALTGFGFLGLAVALILKFSGDLPHFPFWWMMAFSVGAILLLMVYHALIGIFSR
jgi:peptidoglycan/LPS O-acetylase OafA/YrhL